MKKIFTSVFLFATLSANAQTDAKETETDSVEVQIVQLPDSTAIGTPDGKKVSKEIGSTGGTIVSEDGRVELNFPDDALTVNTTISIQPIVNLIPNGNGKAYQFEPSGIKFQKPVQLIFHYSDKEAEICPPELKFMAIQDHNGKWEYMDYDDWDSTARSLKGFIFHFSVFGDGSEVKLVPENTTLKVGDKGLFHLLTVKPPDKKKKESNETEGDELPALPIPDVSLNKGERQEAKWSVNFGQITPQNTKTIQASYVAASMYKESVKVKLEIYITVKTSKTGRAGKRKGKMIDFKSEKVTLGTFISEVNLYDEYKITILKKGSSGLICGAKLEDKSSFNVRLYPDNKRPEISDEINAPPTLTKQAKCGYLKYDPAGCPGPVHVKKDLLFGHGILYSEGATTAPEITLEFAVIKVKIMNQKDKAPNELHHFAGEVVPGVTVGDKIKFKANRLRQDISVGGSAQMSYQLIIDPL